MSDEGPHLERVHPPQRILMAPGPTNLPSEVIEALTAPITGHKDPYFLSVMDETAQLLRYAYQTKSPTCMSLPGTGGAGMEAAMANLIEPGDPVIVCINGLFGTRMAEIARRCGGQVRIVEAPWGKPVDPDDVRRAAREVHPRVISAVHGETSTGVEQPLDELGRISAEHDALFIVDAVATFGGMPVVPDQWGAAICYSASQKCLSAPPGVATVSVSDQAMTYIRQRKVKVDDWYMDLDLHEQYWFAAERAYHHTAPVLLVYALHEALRMVAAEGLEPRFARHRLHNQALTSGLETLGLEIFADPEYRLTTVLGVLVPEGVNDAEVRGGLLNEYGIEIAGGLGAYAGRMWRVGVMGHSATQKNVLAVLSGLETLLARQGYTADRGVAAQAALKVYDTAQAPA
jgi:alanine-glyoxylate transaminase / serine-glyoxylate transaminase / serine-pyruvate transaminase